MDALISPVVQAELLRSLLGFIKVSGLIFLIVTPIVAFMQILRAYRGLEPLLAPLHRLFFWMRIRREATVALLVGILFGIAYGGGVLMEERRSGALDRRDALFIAVFLSLCHALIEDTLIFAAVGADLFVILFVRILFAILVLLVLGRFQGGGPPLA